MSYSDPRYIRKHRINTSLNDFVADLIREEADRLGTQPSTLASTIIEQWAQQQREQRMQSTNRVA